MGHEPVLDISAKVARGVLRRWTKRKHEGYWQSIHGQSQAKGFLKKTSAKTSGELLNLNRSQLRIMMGLPTGHCHLKVICLNWGL